MIKVLICYEIPMQRPTGTGMAEAGYKAGDTYAECQTLDEDVLEGLRCEIRKQQVKMVSNVPGVIVGRPVFRSVTVLPEASVIVKPRM